MPLIRAELQRRKPPLYGPLIHDLSQVLYLPFDHDDGSYARDRSGYNNHGTIYGATLATGKIGMSRFFDGVDDEVRVSNAPSLNPPYITLNAWIRLAGTPITDYEIVSKAWWEQFRFFVSSTRQIGFTVKTEYGYQDLSPAGVVLDVNKYYHVAAVFGDGIQKAYVNGVLSHERIPAGSILSSTYDLYVGAMDPEIADRRWFYGIIDEVHIYNRALSAAEIARLMYLRGI